MRAAARPGTIGVAALLFLLAQPAWAEDRVSVRGMYYREASTRVVQPLAVITKDLPAGFDIGVHYALDAITSASEAQGNETDYIRTELRHEASLAVGKRFDRTRVAVAVRESREPDYQSHSGGVSVTRGVWDNSGVVGLNGSVARDTLSRGALDMANQKFHLTILFAGVSYDQALTPTLRAQLGYEFMYQDGFLGNVYRNVPNFGLEKPPDTRFRHALTPRVARYFPTVGLGLQLHYRFYFDHWTGDAIERAAGQFVRPEYGADPWFGFAHTVEGRIFKELGRDVEVRLSYRYHTQTSTDFYCNTYGNLGGDPGCYPQFSLYYSADEKLGGLDTHMPEVKVYWTPRIFANVPVLRHFAHGTVELSYAYLFQQTHYGDAHFLQSGYTLPF